MLRHLLPSVLCLAVGSLSAADAIVVRASQAVTPIIESAKGLIAAKDPDATFKITPCGTKASVEAVGGGTAQLGATARKLKDDEKAANPDLVLTEIAKDGVALVVHSDNPVANLTKQQVTSIFTGTITNWKEVGGPDLAIAPVGRTEANAVVEFVDGVLGLEHLAVGEGKDQGMSYKLKGAADFSTFKMPVTGKHTDALALVAKTPGGFTYLPLGQAREAKAKGTTIAIITYEGIEASDANVLSATYPLSRSLYLLTKGQPQGAVKDLVEAILSPEGQKVVAERGCVPLH
jgi:phosphate transport system substrate-binding protein